MWDVNDENEHNLEKRDKFIDDIFETPCSKLNS